jgi:hypothetical protein
MYTNEKNISIYYSNLMGLCRSIQAEPVADPVVPNVTTSPVTPIDVLNERNKKRLSVENIECVIDCKRYLQSSPEKKNNRTIYRQSSRAS